MAEPNWHGAATESRCIAWHTAPCQFIFEADGTQSFTWMSEPDPLVKPCHLRRKQRRASAILAGGRLVRFDLDIWRRTVTRKLLKPLKSVFPLIAHSFTLWPAGTTRSIWCLQIDNGRAGRGRSAANCPLLFPLIDCRATLDRSGPLSGVVSGSEDIARALQQWRDNMGGIDVSSLALNWPDAREVLRGSLKLDADDHLSGMLRGDSVGKDSGTHEIQLDFVNGSVKFGGASASATGRPG